MASRQLTSSLSKLHVTSSAIPESYTVTPPIPSWPHHLTPRRLVCLISREPDPAVAFRIFDHASKYHRNGAASSSFAHTPYTYDAVVHKISRARAFSLLDAVLSDLRRSGVRPHESLFVSLIRDYGLAGKPHLSLRTFEGFEEFGATRSVRSLNALLNALVANKRYLAAHSVFRDCRRKYGVIPDLSTCNILVKGMCKKGDLDSAGKVLDEMPAMGLVPNLVTFTTLLGGYARKGDMVGAKRVFGELFDRGWAPDATTYTVLMDGYCKQGRLLDAIKLMDEMEENEVLPNEITYGVMIEAYCKGKRSGESHNLFVDMLERGYVPSSALCCKVVDSLCRDGKVETACALYMRMLKKNCSLDGAIVSTLVYWLCNEGKVWEARRMIGECGKGKGLSALTYGMLIAGMCEIGELGEAGRLWDDMVEKGCKPSAFTYDVMIKGFCEKGSAKEAFGILEEMVKRGFEPDKSTYKMLIEGLVKQGLREEVDKVVIMAVECKAFGGDSWDLLLKKVARNVDEGLQICDALVTEEDG